MNRIDQVRRESFFDELIAPLRRANLRRNVQYLELPRETESYWSTPVSRTGGLELVPAGARDGTALLERLGIYWTEQGDVNLPKLVPYLIALHREIMEPLVAETAEEPPPSDFVYPLF
jgi:hypothetical protein